MKVHPLPPKANAAPDARVDVKLRLDDVLDVLQSTEAHARIDELHTRLAKRSAPADAFDGLVAQALDKGFLRESERKAAIPGAGTYALSYAAAENGKDSREKQHVPESEPYPD